MRRTKIVATLGPASESPEMIRALLSAGVDVVRLNQSHGGRAWHRKTFDAVRAEAASMGKPVAIMVDLQGPKIRVSRMAGGRVILRKGSIVDIVPGDEVGDEHTIYTPLGQLVKDVRPGDRVLLDDGALVLKVVSKGRGRARAKVLVGGPLSDHKGINLPGVDLHMPSVTEEDLDNLRWAASAGADYVAVSFVRSVEDVRVVCNELHRLGSDARVIAKIEKPEALRSIDEIAGLADGLMVARGDLGVEMALEEVPVAQMRIIASAHAHDIPVIVATQMLESMRSSPRPTRAEVSDVAGAIFGGTDAVMLSGETAAGQYPVESVRQMAGIAAAAERHMVEAGTLATVLAPHPVYAVADAVCHGAYSAARDLDARAVFVATASGRTALLFSKYRFAGVVIGASHDEASVRRMALYWGVTPVVVPLVEGHDDLVRMISDEAIARKLIGPGDTVVLVASTPLGRSGATNLLHVYRVPAGSARGARGASRVSGRAAGGTLTIDREACVRCGSCVGRCPAGAFVIDSERVAFDGAGLRRCMGDWRCVSLCPAGAISVDKAARGAR